MIEIAGDKCTSSYKPNPVPDDVIEKLLEAATHAGTASNDQSEQFIVIRDREFLLELERVVVDALWEAGLKYLGGGGIMEKLLTIKYGKKLIHRYSAYSRRITQLREGGGIRGTALT